MKYFLVALASSLFLLSCQNDKQSNNYKSVKHNPSIVDSLKTNAQVKQYLITKVDTNLKNFKMPPVDQLGIISFKSKKDSIFRSSFKKYGVNHNFYKADFDNNGYTDLLLLGGYGPDSRDTYWYSSFVIMNNGSAAPEVHLIGAYDYPFIPKLINSKGKPSLELHGEKPDYNNTKELKFKPFDAIYHWENIGFAEESQNAKKHKIEKIQFVTHGCFGSCPVFEIHITNTGKAFFLAEAYNFKDVPKHEDKTFTTTLSPKTYNEITSFLNYIDFSSLYNNYTVFHTDAASCDLIITYDEGKIKKISDYGMLGSHELIALYTYFEELRFNQKWTETTEPEGLRINTWMKGLK